MNLGEGMRPPANVAWNLFLALIPVMTALALVRLRRRVRGRALRIGLTAALLIVWAAFLPNTCYLVTEWRHYFDAITATPLYDRAHHSHLALAQFLALTFFYICYSGVGVIAFFLSIWPLDRLVRRRSPAAAAACRAAGFVLCAIGVYLGLIHRFNSWDLVNRSGVDAIMRVTAQALSSHAIILLMAVFAVFLWISYWFFDVLMDGLRYRRRERNSV
jgi:uncharacterized membrane protein